MIEGDGIENYAIYFHPSFMNVNMTLNKSKEGIIVSLTIDENILNNIDSNFSVHLDSSFEMHLNKMKS